ncbi:hypothetical protein HAX54_048724 [Datura stramonium]|uniref:Uncharacterized protein n=1 Tax=Datura stramonium TaxID=4076 RepID=A0ABS8SU44_DATST|nr:hypothetical protein [Datura stramonium]
MEESGEPSEDDATMILDSPSFVGGRLERGAMVRRVSWEGNEYASGPVPDCVPWRPCVFPFDLQIST